MISNISKDMVLPGARYEIRMVSQEGGIIPFNYRFLLNGYIYRMVKLVDEEFGMFLHNRGYGKERFKFFVFSDLFVETGKEYVDSRGIHIAAGSRVKFYLSTLLPFIGEQVVYNGIVANSVITIKNIRFFIDGVFTVGTEFRNDMYMKSISPIWIRIPVNRNDKLYSKYLHPYVQPKLFERRLADNIVRKVKVFTGIKPHIEVGIDRKYLELKASKLIKLGKDPLRYMGKVYRYKGGYIKAFYFPIRIIGDIVAISMAYYSGVGHGNPLGFGMLEVADGGC